MKSPDAEKRLRVRLEFSKILFIITSVLTAAVVIFSMIMIWRTLDLTPLSYLIPACFGELATATGFYYSKAKAENKIKLMKSNGVEPTNEDFNSQ